MIERGMRIYNPHEGILLERCVMSPGGKIHWLIYWQHLDDSTKEGGYYGGRGVVNMLGLDIHDYKQDALQFVPETQVELWASNPNGETHEKGHGKNHGQVSTA